MTASLRGSPLCPGGAWLGDGNRAVLPRVAGSVVEPRLVRDSKLLSGAATLTSGCNTLANKRRRGAIVFSVRIAANSR